MHRVNDINLLRLLARDKCGIRAARVTASRSLHSWLGRLGWLGLLRPAGTLIFLSGATDRLQQRFPARKRVHARCEIGESRSGCRETVLRRGAFGRPVPFQGYRRGGCLIGSPRSTFIARIANLMMPGALGRLAGEIG